MGMQITCHFQSENCSNVMNYLEGCICTRSPSTFGFVLFRDLAAAVTLCMQWHCQDLVQMQKLCFVWPLWDATSVQSLQVQQLGCFLLPRRQSTLYCSWPSSGQWRVQCVLAWVRPGRMYFGVITSSSVTGHLSVRLDLCNRQRTARG